jgi:hypothetical protein
MAHNICYHSLDWRLGPYNLTPGSYSEITHILLPQNPIKFDLEDYEMKSVKDFLAKDEKKLEEILEPYQFRILTEYRRAINVDYASDYFEFLEKYGREHKIARDPEYFKNITKKLERDKFHINITPEDFRKSEKKYIRYLLKELFFKEIPLFLFSFNARTGAIYSFKILKSHFFGDAFEERQLERLRERIAERQRLHDAESERRSLEILASCGDVSPYSLNN